MTERKTSEEVDRQYHRVDGPDTVRGFRLSQDRAVWSKIVTIWPQQFLTKGHEVEEEKTLSSSVKSHSILSQLLLYYYYNKD